ncbi:hypothetical protein [Natrarchaeobius oligotrophus]|uniref:Uncharacterized protein n=1 Tax=Natrarchaeobius chitinivorans TaxID=1679083 RepID=A0A3N6PNX2_NATCH|nr:hypothetical protein [Natrarchaeobius chitinivorans]RQH03420.1 hypothetical protein EA472_02325 [Natrarchaeobius chitinivorans]
MNRESPSGRRAVLAAVAASVGAAGTTSAALARNEDDSFDGVGVGPDGPSDETSGTVDSKTTETKPVTGTERTPAGVDDGDANVVARDGIVVAFDHCKRLRLGGSSSDFSHADVASWEADIVLEGEVYEERWTTVYDLPATVTAPGGPNEPEPAALHGVTVYTTAGDRFTVSASGGCRELVERHVEERD